METVLAAETKPLSQVERVVDTFVAPSKTFADILRSKSWWLPCVLVTIIGMATIQFTIQKVGVDEMTESILHGMPKIQDQIDNSPPEQAAKIRQQMNERSKRNIFTIPIGVIVAGFLTSALYLATANFMFGGKASYMRLVAVFWYSLLPLLIQNLLLVGLLAGGVGLENYNAMNPFPTNFGYFMDGSSSVLVALMSALDMFSVWVVILQVLGVAKVANIKKVSATVVVLIWWIIYIGVFKLLPAAFFG